MKINIRGKNKLEITPALRNYIEEKVGKLSDLFNPRHEINANVYCKVYDKYHVVEITIPTKHLILRAESKADTMYAAVDLCVDKIERQLLRHKSRINTLIRKRDGVSSYFSDQFNALSNEENNLHKLVRNKEVELSVMSVDDAILQLELLQHDFYLFINEENHKVTILYVRKDGDYGTIEAK